MLFSHILKSIDATELYKNIKDSQSHVENIDGRAEASAKKDIG